MPRARTKPESEQKPHAPDIVVAARVDEFIKLILDGARMWDLREYVRHFEKDPTSNWTLKEGFEPLSDKMIREYKSRAERVILASVEKDREKLIRIGLAKRLNVYSAAAKAGDWRTALAAQRDHDELLGLYPSAKKLPGDGESQPIVFILPVVVQREPVHPLPFIDAESSAADRDRDPGRQAGNPLQHASGAVEGVE